MSRMVAPGASTMMLSLILTRRPSGGHMTPFFASLGILRRRSTGAVPPALATCSMSVDGLSAGKNAKLPGDNRNAHKTADKDIL